MMESRDLISVSRPVFCNLGLGLEGLRSRLGLGLEVIRSRSRSRSNSVSVSSSSSRDFA